METLVNKEVQKKATLLIAYKSCKQEYSKQEWHVNLTIEESLLLLGRSNQSTYFLSLVKYSTL